MYGEPLIARVLEPHFAKVPMGAGALAGALALAVLTVAHVVLGEIAPKSIALQHAERVARLAYSPMRTVFLVLYPFVWALNGIALALLRALGMRRGVNETERLHTPEELQLVVEESEQGGAIRAEVQPSPPRAAGVRRPHGRTGDDARGCASLGSRPAPRQATSGRPSRRRRTPGIPCSTAISTTCSDSST